MARRSACHPLSRSLTALVLVGALALAACGGGDSGGNGGASTSPAGDPATPTPGGSIVYGIEAETSGGWCLPESQLALPGVLVARAIYEPLTIPNADGEFVPFLAESLTPNSEMTEWTIELREGVTFHDGTELTAEVVKNNLDAYRGAYPARSPMLFLFVVDNIADVTVTGPLTVKVTTKVPWPAFPAFLHLNGRFGIMGQAQLDDPDACDRDLIGTGPFALEEWKPGDHLTVVKHDAYWREGLPYLDEIEFRPVLENTQRLNAVEAGEVDVAFMGGPPEILAARDMAERGEMAIVDSEQATDVTYLLLNASKPPFDNVNARRAFAHALDRETVNEIRNRGLPMIASGPFAPGNLGYLEDTGFPEFDLDKAKQYVEAYEQETGEKIAFTYTIGVDPTAAEGALLIKEMVAKAGMTFEIVQVEQASLISDTVAGKYQAIALRLHGGVDPDTEYPFWHSGTPLNIGRFSDPEIDRLLEAGRVELDREKRIGIYQELNRRLADQVWNVWSTWSLGSIVSRPDLHGVFGGELPDGSEPMRALVMGHDVAELWLEQ